MQCICFVKIKTVQDVDQTRKVRPSASMRRKRKESSSDGERWGGGAGGGGGSRWQSDKPRQCYGPACTRAARSGSKYCSDDCGLKLATNRIYQVTSQPDAVLLTLSCYTSLLSIVHRYFRSN